MTDFDNIIKQKISEKKYAYSAKKWHSFSQKAGIKSLLSAGQVTLISAVSVAVLTVGGVVLHRQLSNNTEPIPTSPEPTTQEVLVTVDTIQDPIPEVENNGSDTCVPTVPAIRQVYSPKQETPITKKDSCVQKVTKTPILRPKENRHILVIRTDTILSNE